MNFEWRRWFSPAHSRNSNWPTSTGFSHRQSFIFAAVNLAPHRPLFASGRFANGHSLVSSFRNFFINWPRTTGVNPLRVPVHLQLVLPPLAVIRQGVRAEEQHRLDELRLDPLRGHRARVYAKLPAGGWGADFDVGTDAKRKASDDPEYEARALEGQHRRM